MNKTKNEKKQKLAAVLAERLCALMDEAGVSIDTLAQATGISSASIASLRMAKTEPGFTVQIILADYFAVPLDYFCGRMDEETARAVLEDYPRHFMEVRRASYEDYIATRKKLPVTLGFESPWPYNLYEEITGELAEGLLRDDQNTGLEKALSTLTDRERDGILWYYRDGLSYEKIGRKWNVMTERARQIVAKAMRKLRHPTRKKLIEKGYDPELDAAEKELALKWHEIEMARAGLNAELAGLDELRAQIGILRGKLDGLAEWDEERRRLPETESALLDYPVDEMDLSVRAFNILSRAQIKTLGDIIKAEDEGRLMYLRNMGRKSYDEVLDKVRQLLHLDPEAPITVKGE